MTRILGIIAALVLALALNPAAAMEQTLRGYVNPQDGAFIIALEIEGDSESQARMMYREVNDDDLIENELGVWIMEKEAVTGTSLLGLGADDATLYAIIYEDGYQPGLLVTARSGDTIYLLVSVGGELDGGLFAEYCNDVLTGGLADADDPGNFLEIDVADDDTEPDFFEGSL